MGVSHQVPAEKERIAKRVGHNFIPLNEQTIKPQHPMHRVEEVVEVIIKPKFVVFLTSDASNGY